MVTENILRSILNIRLAEWFWDYKLNNNKANNKDCEDGKEQGLRMPKIIHKEGEKSSIPDLYLKYKEQIS